MPPQRRTALVSVLAACVLIVVKLATGLATGSLGLVSEAVHSGTDLVAALLTFFAVGVAGRPARPAPARGPPRRYASAAIAANALHFAGDFAGSTAVLVGLLAVRAGYTTADSAGPPFRPLPPPLAGGGRALPGGR